MNYQRNASGCGLIGTIGMVIIGMACLAWFLEHAMQLAGMANSLSYHLNNLSKLLNGG
jgi:hypothetical protein